MQPTEERWLPVVGYEGLYEVSDQGRVRALARILPSGNLQRARTPKNDVGPRGHLRVHLRDHDFKAARVFIHILVLTTFGCPRPNPADECRHLDGDPANNTLGNLQWGTRSENALDRVRHGNDAMIRKTHCPQGHPYNEENTYWRPLKPGERPSRGCKICRRDQSQRAAAKKRAA